MRSYILNLLVLLGVHFTLFSQVLTRDQKADSILNFAKKEVGLREKTGNNDHPRIDEYRATVAPSLNKIRPRLPYCGYFVYWCFVQAGEKPKVANPGRAASWFDNPKRIVQYARHGNTRRINSKIKRGMVTGYRFLTKSNRISHIDIIERWDDDDDELYFYIIAGNTGSSLSVNTIIREGDGVYHKKRQKAKVAAIADWLD